ncbi:phage tail terminator family protein [Paenibacillus alba]|uniref:Phage portal protein n=1 Tax=Paenibacillus alba TaxID=1197127 RepID=A0ABU6GEG4_9BACL|nr:hypothetical protein [Paenibacillus alba]MEC0232276.1 hypothetical protein [Paenibacillus alba]NQX68062.1 hypothetical protein [Paenibacillus alba]
MIEADIESGIVTKLKELEPDLPVYTEQIVPRPLESAFFIQLISSGQVKGLNRRYTRSLLYHIAFYPKPESVAKKEDCRRMGERLYAAMGIIDVNGPIRARNLSCEVVDEVLHFSLDFQVTLVEEKPIEPKMKNLDQEVRT